MEGIKTEHREVAKGTFWSLAGSMALKLISFIYTIIIARLFAQEDVGTFYLALSIMYPLSLFGDLGLNYAFNRYVPYYIGKKEKNKTYALLNTAYIYSGTLSLILGVILLLTAGNIAEIFQNPNIVPALQAVAVFLVFFTFFMLNTSFLTGMKRIKENNLLLNTQNFLKLILTILIMWIFGANIYALSIGFLVSYILVAMVSFYYVDKELKNAKINVTPPKTKERIELLKEVVPFGIMLAGVTMFWAIATNVDRILLGYILPVQEATVQIAIYSMALALATLITVFPSAIVSILLPVMSEMHGIGTNSKMQDKLLGLSHSTVRWTTFMLVPLTILLIAFPQEILNMFYGPEYSVGWPVLIVLTIGLFIRSLSTVHGTILASMRVVSIELTAAVIALVINIVLNVLLIPKYGITGSAIAALISFLAVTIMLVYYCKKLAGFGLSWEFFRPIFAGIAALGILLILKGQVIELTLAIPEITTFTDSTLNLICIKILKLLIFGILFLVSCIAYGMILFLLKGIKNEDWEIISVILKKGKIPTRIVEIVERLGEKEYV